MPSKNLFLILLFPAFAAFGGSLEEARSLIDQEQFEMARSLLETAVKNPANEAEASLLLTSTFDELGDWKSAVKYGEKATELLPKSSDAHYRYAVALRTKMMNSGKMKAICPNPIREILRAFGVFGAVYRQGFRFCRRRDIHLCYRK